MIFQLYDILYILSNVREAIKIYKCVIFDLDGTVLNTLEDLAEAGNHALSCMGFAPHPVENYRYYVGNGIPMLIKRILPPDADENMCGMAYGYFCSYYNEHMYDKTAPYDGMPETLEKLKGAGLKLALVSNKAHEFSCDIAEKYFPNIFDAVFGSIPDKPRKPDPYWVFHVLKMFEVKPYEAFYTGDSGVDMQTAKNADVKACGALWGFRGKEELLENGADIICERCSDLTNIILGSGY